MATKDFNVKNGLTAGNIVLDAPSSTIITENLEVLGETSLGPVNNVSISGGSSGQVLSTDGAGNLSWIESGGVGNTAYVYTQASPATTWTINHNLGVQYVNIQVIDSTGKSFTGRYNYPTVTFNNTTHCTVTFDSAQAGYAAVTSGGGQTGPQGPAGGLGGSNTQIQFNDNGTVNATAGFTFNKTTNTVTISNALSVTGNANVGNIGATNGVFTSVSGNGANLSSITGANVTGTVANATYAVSAGSATTATSATTAGTVTTAAQPNITSVGTLTSLTMNGNINAALGNVTASNFLSGSTVQAVGNILGGNVYANGGTIGATLLTGTLTTDAQPNITSVGTLTSLSVTGNITSGGAPVAIGFQTTGQQVISTNTAMDGGYLGTHILAVTGGITLTLPTSATNGKIVTISNISTGNITLSYTGSTGTDGPSVMVPGTSLHLISDGSTPPFWRMFLPFGAFDGTTLHEAGYKGIPQNSKSAQYTLALSDMGEHIDISTGGVIIPANSSVAFPIGATIVIFNDSASTQTISITSDTLRQAGTTNTGTRTLAVYGVATLLKVAATVWVVSGNVT